MFDDLITWRTPPPNRVNACEHDVEHHLSEGAVMIAFAMHLLRSVPALKHAAIHPDGEHGKRFAFRSWLERHGFAMTAPMGGTSYGGTYSSGAGLTVRVQPISGRGDVVAEMGAMSIVAECKGGVLNTKHPGAQSRLRKGLCESIGLLLASPVKEGRRQFAVVPRTNATANLAQRLVARAQLAGIEIALVDGQGNVAHVRPN